MHVPAHYRVGSFDLAVVSDGYTLLDGGAVFGLIPRTMWEPVIGIENIDENYRIRLGLNCLVIRRGNEIILCDTGMGTKQTPQVREKIFPGDYGYLLQNISALGISPADVTAVVNTHLHADHCGWNTMREGDAIVPTFPNARYYIQAGEYEAATHPNDRTRGTYFLENFTPLEVTGQMQLVTGECEIAPGVSILPTPGHTQDHASIVVRDGSESAIYMGDTVHHAVQAERPAWIPAFDTLPLVSLETKKMLAERAVRENALLICVHNEYPGVGRLTEVDGRRKFVNE